MLNSSLLSAQFIIQYRGVTYTHSVDLSTAKILFNSVISDPGAKFFGIDVSNIYLKTKFASKYEYEYMYIPAWAIPPDIMQKYNLHSKIHSNRVPAEIRTGMYGLPQAGRLAYIKLIGHLAKDGYIPTGHTPGLFKHITRPILFNLVITDFGVKFRGKQHAEHLIATLKKRHDITVDWDGSLFCGIHLTTTTEPSSCPCLAMLKKR